MEESWKRLKQWFFFFFFFAYMTAIDAGFLSWTWKVALLLTLAGVGSSRYFYSFQLSPEIKSEDNLRHTAHLERLKLMKDSFFHTKVEKENKKALTITSQTWSTRSCNFGPLNNCLIRDRLVGVYNDAVLQEHLLKDCDLPLEKHKHLQSSRTGKTANAGFKQRGYQGDCARSHSTGGQEGNIHKKVVHWQQSI